MAKEKRDSGPRKYGKVENSTRKEEVFDDQTVEDDPEWPDAEEDDDQSGLQEKGLIDGTGSDYDAVISEEPELEDMLSD